MPNAAITKTIHPLPSALQRFRCRAAALAVIASTASAGLVGNALADEPALVRGRFVVVHAAALDAIARQWAEYRQSQGWETATIDASTCAQGAPRDIANRIRDRIRECHRSGPALPEGGEFHVLLLGDVEHIPAFHHPQTDPVLIGPDGLADICTDHPYQLTDDADDRPDFAVGRVPARTSEEARAVLEKIRRYETEAPGGPWRRRITYLAGEGHFGGLDAVLERMFVAMVDQIVPYAFDVSMTYANPRSPYCAPPSRFNEVVLDRLDDGALLVNYVGHGHSHSLDRLYVGERAFPVCDVESARSLRVEGGRLPLALLIACWTGRYDMPGGRRSLGEELLFNPHGPVAVVAGSRMTHPYANAVFQKDFTQQLCVARLETVGAVDLAATRALAEPDEQDLQLELLAMGLAQAMDWATPPADLRAMHMGLYNLLGDPATRIAYPSEKIEDLRCALLGTSAPSPAATGATAALDARTLTIAVTGRAPAGRAGTVAVTLESPRAAIPRRDDLTPVRGADDPDLESKTARNYSLANDKVLCRAQGVTDEDGRFTVHFRVAPDDLLAFDRTWVKAYFTAADDSTGASDAFGAIAFDPAATE